MKVVLINPPLASKQRLYRELAAVKINYPPLGLCYLASVLREKGFKVKILDLQIYEEGVEKQARRVLRERPELIGVTAATVAVENAANLAAELKKEIGVPIVLGGPHITAVPRKTMELFPQFDAGVVGEGEETLLELLSVLKPLRRFVAAAGEIPGLVIRDPKKGKIKMTGFRKPIENLDRLPLPAFDLLPGFSHYGGSQFIEFDARPTFRLVTSRGCPFSCRFCDKSVFGKKFRAHSPEYVLEMVKILYQDYGIRHVYFSDDTFSLDKERIFKLCRLLEEENLDLTWDCNTRVDTVNLALLRAMKKAGCGDIAYGIETGSQEILDNLGKGITLKGIRQACDWTVKAGIKIRGNFIIGNPGETKETIEETIKFAKSLPLYTFKMAFFTPFPNTEIYDEVEKWGTYKEDWSRLSKYSPVFVPRDLTRVELERNYKKAYFSFYFRPKVVFNYLSQFKSLTALKYAWQNFLILSRFLLGRKLKRHQAFITFLISLLIFGLLFSKIKVKEIIGAVSLVDGKLFLLACLLSVGVNFFWITDKWRRILKVLGYDLSCQELFLPRIGGYALHGVLPLKSGEASRVAYLKKFHQVPLRAGIGSVAITLGLNILALLVFIAWGLLA